MSGPPHEPARAPLADVRLSRRRMLALAGGAALSLAAPWPMRAAPSPERRLCLHNLHTGERLDCVYFADRGYVVSALGEIDRVLRDHRTGEVKSIDLGLLDLLHALGESLEVREGFHVISGYRSPATNAMLRARGAGVGARSLHLYGMAIDVAVPGRDVAAVRDAALALRGGGVGYYPGSGFVHLDVGRVRSW